MHDLQIAAQLNETARVLDEAERDGYLTARLNAHTRSIEALSGRIDLEQRTNDRQDAELTEHLGRLQDLESVPARLSRLEARIEEIARLIARLNLRMG
jgi:hypothetical protein